jgi:dTDP-D-glucose 4,6-dehydratase
LDIIKTIGSILNQDVRIEHVEDRLGHDKKYGLNSKQMKFYYLSKDKTIEFKNLYDYLEEHYGNEK